MTDSNKSAPDGVFLGFHDVFHYRKSYSLCNRVDQPVLKLHLTGHGILLHVLER